jgi:hypothetical protein
MTNTHNKSLAPHSFDQLHEIWNKFMINEFDIWRRFHEYWLDDCTILSSNSVSYRLKTRQSDILLIRYEDLLFQKEVKLSNFLTIIDN